MMIMATILLLKHNAREHDWTAVSLWFSGCLSLYRVSIMGVLYRYYHLFSQNFTGRCDIATSLLLSHLSTLNGGHHGYQLSYPYISGP